jgi:hypothetical protein
MLDSDFGDSKFGKAGGGPGSSSSDDPIIHPLGGTFTCVSPSRASSLGEFFFGTVSGEEVTGTRGRSPFSEFTRRGLGTGRSAFSGGPDDEEGESDEAVVGGEMGEGMRGVGCWVQEGRSGSMGSEENDARGRGCRGATIATLGEREMSLSRREEVGSTELVGMVSSIFLSSGGVCSILLRLWELVAFLILVLGLC